jgi:hypothetical protein
MGVTVALPLLDAMVPAATALAQTAARPVRRFGAVYVPHGLLYSQWVPATAGPAFEFSADPQTARAVPRSPDRDQRLVGGTDGPERRSRGRAGRVSVRQRAAEADREHGRARRITVDQVIAKAAGQTTVFPSMELASRISPRRSARATPATTAST